MNRAYYKNLLRISDLYTQMGKIDKIIGMTVEATGITCSMGDVCQIVIDKTGKRVTAEVVGFKENRVLLMPYSDTEGIRQGSRVLNTGEKLMLKVSDQLIGRTVNALGQPIDGGPPIEGGVPCLIGGVPSNPMQRPRIDTPIEMGVRVIDGCLTIGKGQRMGIFAGSGVGKSTLMGMIARNTKAQRQGRRQCHCAGRRTRARSGGIPQPRPWPRGAGAFGYRRRHQRPTRDATQQMRALGHRHRRVLLPSRQRCASDDGLPHPLLHGSARDRPLGRRAAGGARLYPFDLRRAAKALGACRKL